MMSNNQSDFYPTITTLLFALFSQLFFTTTAIAQDQCAAILAKAEQAVNEDFDFEEAIRIAQSCLEQEGPSQQDKMQTYEFLGNCYIALDDTAKTAQAVKELLEINREYDPTQNPANRDRFKEMVANIRTKFQLIPKPEDPTGPGTEIPEDGGSRFPWLRVGGGAAFVAVIAILASGGSGDDPPMPVGFVNPLGRPPTN